MKVKVGENSLSMAIVPRDIEHLEERELATHYEDFTQSLLKMGDGHFLKVYFNDGSIYFNTNNLSFSMPQVESKSCPNIIEKLLGENTPLG